MTVFIATPCYSGDVCCQYTVSLLHTMAVLGEAGIAASPYFEPANALISLARAHCVQGFMASEATDLFFIDSDLQWDANAVLSMVQAPYEFVAGIYPHKTPDHTAKYFCGGMRLSGENGYLEADTVPGGFMRLKRSVIEKMIEAYPETKSWNNRGDRYMLFENMILPDGTFYGEDYAFSKRWRDIGGKIYVDPNIEFSHYGRAEWRGNMVEDDPRFVKEEIAE